MKVLLTGVTGYIGKRLLPMLLDEGHHVVCSVRDRNRMPEGFHDHARVSVVVVDFLQEGSEAAIPPDIDAAYYLIHSMTSGRSDFSSLEARSAEAFVRGIDRTGARQIIYLGGITPDKALSQHLASRKQVGDILRSSRVPVTELQAGIIIGSGSASFEIMRDLVEKLPVMITTRWLNIRHQPIAVRDVLNCLSGVLGREDCMPGIFPIGGTEVLTYKQMLLVIARVRGLRRLIMTVPVMTPRLSSYWLYFITSTSYPLAVQLVNSMKIEVLAGDGSLAERLGIERTPYEVAVRRAFQVMEDDAVPSSWKDALSSSPSPVSLPAVAEVPEYGVYRDLREMEIPSDEDRVLDNIWSIGGERGWYVANILWRLRGMLDSMVGGVGLRRGRTNRSSIHTGDAIDFWRVLAADRAARRLLLFAEMKVPGEAWLEFRIVTNDGRSMLRQTATFRPRGLSGRLYWYAVMPFHALIFGNMCRRIITYRDGKP